MTTHKKLLDQLRERIRAKHYSIRTEQAYPDWARRYILHHAKKKFRLLSFQKELSEKTKA